MTERITNSDLHVQLGRLIEGQEHADKGRAVIHDKLDRHSEMFVAINSQIAEIGFTIKATTDIAMQARNAVQELRDEYDRDKEETRGQLEASSTFQRQAAPIIEVMKSARSAMYVLIALMAVLGFSTGGVLIFANDQAVEWARAWLKITPS